MKDDIILDEHQLAILRDSERRAELAERHTFTTDQLAMVGQQMEAGLNLDQTTRVTYSDFVARGLPILATMYEEFNQGAWLEYVGQSYVGLEVLNPDGSIRYSIPSLYRQLPTAEGSFDDRYLDHINELIGIRMDSPDVAARVQYNHLSTINPSDTDEEIKDGIASLNVFNQIFRDHGMPTFRLDVEKRQLVVDGVGDGKLAIAAVEVPANSVRGDADNDFSEDTEEL